MIKFENFFILSKFSRCEKFSRCTIFLIFRTTSFFCLTFFQDIVLFVFIFFNFAILFIGVFPKFLYFLIYVFFLKYFRFFIIRKKIQFRNNNIIILNGKMFIMLIILSFFVKFFCWYIIWLKTPAWLDKFKIFGITCKKYIKNWFLFEKFETSFYCRVFKGWKQWKFQKKFKSTNICKIQKIE